MCNKGETVSFPINFDSLEVIKSPAPVESCLCNLAFDTQKKRTFFCLPKKNDFSAVWRFQSFALFFDAGQCLESKFGYAGPKFFESGFGSVWPGQVVLVV